MKTFERLFVDLNKWVLIGLLSAMSVIVFTNVSLRYLTNFSLTWAEEVARYLMIWMTFLGAGLVLRVGGHVAITNLHDAMPAPAQRMLRVLIGMLILCFCAVMIWIGYEYMSRMGRQVTPATRISFSYVYAAMPIGFGLLVIHFVLVAKSYFLGEQLDQAEVDGLDPHASAG